MRLKLKFRFCHTYWVLETPLFPASNLLTGSTLTPNQIVKKKLNIPTWVKNSVKAQCPRTPLIHLGDVNNIHINDSFCIHLYQPPPFSLIQFYIKKKLNKKKSIKIFLLLCHGQKWTIYRFFVEPFPMQECWLVAELLKWHYLSKMASLMLLALGRFKALMWYTRF